MSDAADKIDPASKVEEAKDKEVKEGASA